MKTISENRAFWREVEIARGASHLTCPVHAPTQSLHYARIAFGPSFVAVSRNGVKATGERLRTVHQAGRRGCGLAAGLSKADRLRLFSGHSFRGTAGPLAMPASTAA